MIFKGLKKSFFIFLGVSFSLNTLYASGTSKNSLQPSKDKAVKSSSKSLSKSSRKKISRSEKTAYKKFKKQKEAELISEVIALGSEQKAIKQLKILLKKYRGTSMEPALLFRLAELYISKSKSSRTFEILEEEYKTGDLSKSPSVSFIPKHVLGKEKLFILEAIKVYEVIEDKYSNFEQIDLVLYNNGFAHLQAEMKSGAELVFLRLLRNKKLRNSKLIPETLLSLGEISFQQNNFAKALAFFELINKYPKSQVYSYGLYKAAWSSYNLSDPKGALARMEKVVALGHQSEKTNPSQFSLRRDALNDMPLFFSEAKSASQGVSYFKKYSKGIDPIPYLEKLTRIYSKHGKLKKEETVLRGLVRSFSSHPRRPLFHKRLVESYNIQSKVKKAMINLVKFDKTCDVVLALNSKEIKDPEVKDCKNLVDIFSFKVAKKWLKEWKREEEKKYGIAAEQGFRIHLRESQPSAQNSDARYALADILFAFKKFSKASQEYEIVGNTTKDKEKARDARYGALVALDKSVKGKWNKTNEKRLKFLTGIYLKNYPLGKHYLSVSFKVGLLDYTNKAYDLAQSRLYGLGKRFSRTDKGKKSQDLYLDILNTKKDYIALQRGALEWKSLEKDPERQVSLQKIFEESYFSHVQVVITEEKFREAINLYRRFVSQYSQSNLADEAQWNIIDVYLKWDDQMGAAQAYFNFYKKFPKHEKSLESLIRSADLYEQMGQPEEALKVAQALVVKDPKNSASWGMLIGDFYAASGRYYRAIKEFKKIFINRKYASSTKIQDVALQAIDRVIFLSDQLSQEDRYFKVLKEMSQSKLRAVYSPAVSTYAENLKKQGKIKALSRWVGQNSKRKLYKGDRAKLNYISGTLKERRYLAMKLRDSNVNLLTKDIDVKTKILVQVQKDYEAGTKGGDAYTTVNSLIGLARLYQGFVTSLSQIEGPRSFSEEEKLALKDELSNIVFPFEEKAVETVDTALKLAKKSDLRDGSVGQIQRILDKLNLKRRSVASIKMFLPNPVFANDKTKRSER